ncbi:hypothetical protein NY2A_b778R [Paramecium bursaria Chlorella virus NY2A]|uniref:Uncharacterized protein b778R n=1 Tax=Paramecium bursaria Chlorella virus NY2A TaxID=46021 RepID=A7IXV3_PBCVN|nr:hypothetical protein NY2A_b778R [Paramecium bursaria Chlorella virus NY2A]ABT15177.1 hypothetical protein NY2A_b778R [Paramecium bursaria Chlorella virus NY2A]
MSCLSRKQKNACSYFFLERRRDSSGSHERQYAFPLTSRVLTGHGTPSYPGHILLMTSIASSGLQSEHHCAFSSGRPKFTPFPHVHFLCTTSVASYGLHSEQNSAFSPGRPNVG